MNLSSRSPTGRKIRQEVLSKSNGRCAYCGIELDITSPENAGKAPWDGFQIDHVKPRKSRSNSTVGPVENMKAVCKRCNMKKSTRTLEEFRRSMRFEAAGIEALTARQERFFIREWPEYYDHLPRYVFYFERNKGVTVNETEEVV